MLSDIFPTGYRDTELAGVQAGDDSDRSGVEQVMALTAGQGGLDQGCS
jgi:hypothetical protein